ncbi:MAG: rRNA maturation RNase YbeY [Synergistaceae bacterium]|nr:rRNA maturation RNase YbeY [Synergistaceae bacterium]
MKINIQENSFPEVFGIKNTHEFISAAEKLGQAKLEDLKLVPEQTSEISFALTFADKEEMRTVNLRYREVNAPTDVLSFPLWENEEGLFMPPEDWQELPLGDVLICPDVIISNAAENGKQPEEELALVIFHALLHLTGYDHDTEDRRKVMWEIQDELVGQLIKELKQ